MIDTNEQYLLGYCSNKDCSEYDGGWKYPLNLSEEEMEDCTCPSCGDRLKFQKHGGTL